jgi:hypothetical protein
MILRGKAILIAISGYNTDKQWARRMAGRARIGDMRGSLEERVIRQKRGEANGRILRWVLPLVTGMIMVGTLALGSVCLGTSLGAGKIREQLYQASPLASERYAQGQEQALKPGTALTITVISTEIQAETQTPTPTIGQTPALRASPTYTATLAPTLVPTVASTASQTAEPTTAKYEVCQNLEIVVAGYRADGREGDDYMQLSEAVEAGLKGEYGLGRADYSVLAVHLVSGESELEVRVRYNNGVEEELPLAVSQEKLKELIGEAGGPTANPVVLGPGAIGSFFEIINTAIDAEDIVGVYSGAKELSRAEIEYLEIHLWKELLESGQVYLTPNFGSNPVLATDQYDLLLEREAFTELKESLGLGENCGY